MRKDEKNDAFVGENTTHFLKIIINCQRNFSYEKQKVSMILT